MSTPETSTAVAKTASALPTKAPKTLRDFMQMDEFKQKLRESLPKHCSPDRFVRVALTALTRVPKLMECTQESVFQCLYQLSSLGLEPDGRRAHLIPYRDNKNNTSVCTLIVDYKGIVELIRNSAAVSYIAADVVCEHDEFDFVKGTGAFLKHKPAIGNRGKVTCAYSFVKLRDGSEDFCVMNADEIEGIRKRSRAGNAGPWVSDWNEMAKKTVFRRHSKWLPFSPELREAIEKDDDQFDLPQVVVKRGEVGRLPEGMTPFDIVESEPVAPESGKDASPASEKAPASGNQASPTDAPTPTFADPLKELHLRISTDGVTEAQVVAYCKQPAVALCKPTTEQVDQMKESSISTLLGAWNKGVLANIRKQEIKT